MYRGWIIAGPEDQDRLEKLGIVVGAYNKLEGCFDNCKVSDEALEKLDLYLYWGEFFWGLVRED